MKILTCHNFYQSDGGENMVFRKEQDLLRQAGHEVVEYSRQSTEITGSGWLARLRMFAAGFYSRRTVREVIELVERERPDVAIVQNVFPLLSPSLYRALHGRVPIVQLVFNYRLLCPNAELFTQGSVCELCIRGNTLHAIRYRCYRQSRIFSGWYAGIIGLHRALRTFHMVDRFVVADQFLGRKLVEGGFAAEKVRINSNPFDAASFSQAYESGDYALFVGRFTRAKGVLTLVNAFALASAPRRLVMVGGGEALPEVEALIREKHLEDRIQLAGTVWGEQLRQLVAGCQFVVVPSEWYDNTPMIIYQAYAQGKAVIASRLGGVCEDVEDGENGILFTAADARDLAQKMESLAAQPELLTQLGARARRKALAEFSVEAHQRGLQAILDEVVRR
jgi:glycosyltransferase involved in cell wall biosynthesis